MAITQPYSAVPQENDDADRGFETLEDVRSTQGFLAKMLMNPCRMLPDPKWLIVFCAAWHHLWLSLMFNSSGVIYVSMVETFNITREEASWPFSLSGSISLLMGPVTGVLNNRWNPCLMGLLGTVIASLGIALSSVVLHPVFITYTYGILTGIGYGIVYPSYSIVINTVFTKNRASGNGVRQSGLTLAAIIFPPLLVVFISSLGLQGAIFLCGGLALNTFPACFLIHKLSKLKKDSDNVWRPNVYHPQTSVETTKSSSSSQLPNFREKSIDLLQIKKTDLKYDYAVKVQDNSLSQNSESHIYKQCYAKTNEISSVTLHDNYKVCKTESPRKGVEVLQDKVTSQGKELQAFPCDIRKKHSATGLPSTDRLSFLKKPIFYLICLSGACFRYLLLIPNIIIVDVAMDKGLGSANSALLISTSAIGDFLARFLSGWISDKKILPKRKHFFALNFFLIGVIMILMPLCNTFLTLSAIQLAFGWCCGSIIILFSVLLTDHLGLPNLALSLGVLRLTNGLVSFARSPFVGYFRDVELSYIKLYYVLGVSSIAISSLWAVEFAIEGLTVTCRSERKTEDSAS